VDEERKLDDAAEGPSASASLPAMTAFGTLKRDRE
jgi:hypothetical protein